MTASLFVNAVAFNAPGLGCAAELFAHFDGAPLAAAEAWTPMPERLPRRQALRLSESTRLAMLAAEQIAGAVPAQAAWVFASSTGDGWTLNEILASLSRPGMMIQPLRFQNAVHNAAQGQWSIAAGATGPATSIAAYDDSVGAGMLKAMMQAALERTDVGLVLFDAPLPPPLHEKRPVALPMAAAFALSPEPGAATLCRLALQVIAPGRPSDPAEAAVAQALRCSGNPVRFVLPLLERIHRADPRPLVLGLPGGAGLEVTVGEAPDAR
ncbi:MAG TPA: beta-ketoacyl synthase chain length factor [Thermohalobaculum sp.]|nr:beta-ketoacyl synthase chain length factor [Thermohalobaculum sp.]